MSKNRKYQKHGQKEHVRKTVTLAGTGAQTATIDLREADHFEFNTDACTATTLTLSVTGLYDGARAILDYDSNVACDTLTIQADDGTGDTILASGTFDDNARNLIEIYVFKDTKDAAELAVRYATIS